MDLLRSKSQVRQAIFRRALVAIGFVATLSCFSASKTKAEARAYDMYDVVYPGGWPLPCDTWPNDINDDGIVVGAFFFSGDPYHAFVWQNGVMIDVYAAYPNVTWDWAAAISLDGSIAGGGYVFADDEWHIEVFIYYDDEFTILPVPAGCYSNDEIAAISPNGRYLIGECPTLIAGGDCIPAFYDVELGLALNLELPAEYPEGSDMEALSVNSHGTVVGVVGGVDGLPNLGFIWSEGMIDTIESTLGGVDAGALGINCKGTIVGVAEVAPDDCEAMILQNGTMTVIGPGGPFDVNERDQAVGRYIENFSVTHAVLYEKGQVIELNSFLPDDWTGKHADAINNYGWIIGTADNVVGRQVGWLLVPIYEKGDFDGDEDVDLQDFGHFQRCFAAEPYIDGTLHIGCSVFDFDDDADLDLADYEAFQAAFSGPK